MEFNRVPRGPDAQDPVLKANPVHRQLRPVFGQPRIELETVSARGKAEKAVEHDLGDHRALEEFLVEPEAARRAAALQRPFARSAVILAVAAGRLNFLEPRHNLAQTLPRVVRPKDIQPRHEVVIREPQHRPAVLHLAAPGDALRVAPRPEIPIHVAPRGGPRPETPVVNVLALRGVARHDAVAVNPAQDCARVLRRGKAVIDGLEVKEGKPVVVRPAVRIHTRIEPLRLAVPEQAVAFGFYLLGMAFEHCRVETEHAAGYLPFGVLPYLALEDGHHADGVVVLDRGIGIQPAKGQQVPVVVAYPLPGQNGFRAIRPQHQPAPAVVADPIGIDHLALERVMLRHDIPQGAAHAVDLRPQETQVARPPEILRAPADEVLAVDIVPRVILREESLEDDTARGCVAQADAQLSHLPCPLRVAIHRNHGVADGIALHRLKEHPARRTEVRPGRSRPFNERLRRAQAGRLPAKLEEGHLERVALPRRRRHHCGGIGDLNAPSVFVDASLARPRQRPAIRFAQVVRPPAWTDSVLE